MGSGVTGLRRQIADHLDEFRMRGVGTHIEYVDLAVVEAAGPEIFAVVRESHVMRFAAAADGNLVNDFSVGFGRGIHIDGDELVRSVAQAGHAECPHMHEILLALDQAGHVGRIARLVGVGHVCGDAEDSGNAKAQDPLAIDSHDYFSQGCPPLDKLPPYAVKSKSRAVSPDSGRPYQIDLTSPPSIRSVDPVIQRAPGETRNAISSAISSGSP